MNIERSLITVYYNIPWTNDDNQNWRYDGIVFPVNWIWAGSNFPAVSQGPHAYFRDYFNGPSNTSNDMQILLTNYYNNLLTNGNVTEFHMETHIIENQYN